MTDEKLAKLIGTTRQTISRWKKEYPERIRLLKQGLALDKTIEETEKHLQRLREIRENANK
jgi:DNA-binding XRE family transcriptional regulator